MKSKNISAYQVNLVYIDKEKNGEVYKDKWDSSELLSVLKSINDKDKLEKRQILNGWFMLLHELNNEKAYITGCIQYAEYGYIGNLIDADTLSERENPKKLREGEEKYVHFLFRKNDGLLLLQGDTKITRAKFEDYINNKGKDKLDEFKLYGVQLETLLRTDFFEEIDKLDKVGQIHLEIETESPFADENEVITNAKRKALELNSTHFMLSFHAKYKRKGLEGYIPFLKSYHNKKGVSKIKVVGKKGKADKVINTDTYAEKYPVSIKTDQNGKLVTEDAYTQIKRIAENRELIRRDDKN